MAVRDLPSLSHSANVNGFMVEPGWNPPAPLRSLPLASLESTLKFSWVSNFPGAGRKTVFCAIARILPVPGAMETIAAPHLSGLAPAVASTCACAASLEPAVQGGGDGQAAAEQLPLALGNIRRRRPGC